MKHLMTLAALLVSTAAVAQIPTLPWNPDGNDDQFIGLPDLLGLLTVYGQEFENAIVSEDGESAIMYMGDMGYPLCAMACKNLPGLWSIPALDDLGPVYDDLGGGNETWLKKSREGTYNPNNGEFLNLTRLNPNGYMYATANWAATYRCYCTAKQMPRVEYEYCSGTSGFVDCCQNFVSEGWYPLNSNPRTMGGNGTNSQAFWRFAQ